MVARSWVRRGSSCAKLGRVSTDQRRQERAATFDQAVERYQRARPEYPPELYERLLAVTGLTPPAHLVEIGSVTGKASLPLAKLGFRLTHVEPGPHLAARARELLGDFDVEVVESRFEDWEPPAEKFVMVWVDPAVRYRPAATSET